MNKPISDESWRPEPQLKQSATEMLAIAFDPKADDNAFRSAVTTLVEIVAPYILERSLPEHLQGIAPPPPGSQQIEGEQQRRQQPGR